MKILITGTNGFIGQHLSQALISRKHSVIGLGRQKKPALKNIRSYFCGSVLDKDIVKKAVQHANAIVHLAALTAHQDIIDNKFKSLEINFLGTKNVLDAFVQSKSTRKFIYASTGKTYGNIQSLPINENHPALPLNPLGKSKLITEKLIDFYANNQKSFIIFRIFNVFGPKQKDNFLVPTILNQLKQANSITLGDIKAERDYLYIDDIIKAFVLAIEKKTNSGLDIFNICSGKSKSAQDIVNEIGKIQKRKINIKINKVLFRKDEKNIEYGSYKKAKKILGWKPDYSLRKGLKNTIDLSL